MTVYLISALPVTQIQLSLYEQARNVRDPRGPRHVAEPDRQPMPGRRHTATFGSPIAAKPRVMELVNFVETSLSPTFAGRDVTRCRL
jgi:hypothetical protein